MDKDGNIHLNITDFCSGIGNYVTTTAEHQNVLGVKTFDKGIGIGNYLMIPDEENDAIKVIHRDKTKAGNLYTTGWLSALGAASGGTSGSGASALYQLIDVKENAQLNGVYGAEEGSVLKYDGTHWYAADDEGLDLIKLEDYLLKHKYLTVEEADRLFLTPAEGDELFLTQEEGDARYLLKIVFSKIFTAYDANGNIVDITDFDTVIDNIGVNYNFWSKGYVSALGK